MTFALAYLLQLQICAILFNLIPVPPLDGFQALDPWLPGEWRERIMPLASQATFVLFLLVCFVEPVNHAFWSAIYGISDFFGVPHYLGMMGQLEFRFWEQR